MSVVKFSPAGVALGLDKRFEEELAAKERAVDLLRIEKVLKRVLSDLLEKRKVMRNIDLLAEAAGIVEPRKPVLFSKMEFLDGYVPLSKDDAILESVIEGRDEALEKLALRVMGLSIYELTYSEDEMRIILERVCEDLSNPGMAMTILEKAWDGIGMWVS